MSEDAQNRLVFVIVVIILILVGTGMFSFQAGYNAGNPFKHQCPTEDSVSCYWNADKRGNEQGTSFVVDDEGTVYYKQEVDK